MMHSQAEMSVPITALPVARIERLEKIPSDDCDELSASDHRSHASGIHNGVLRSRTGKRVLSLVVPLILTGIAMMVYMPEVRKGVVLSMLRDTDNISRHPHQASIESHTAEPNFSQQVNLQGIYPLLAPSVERPFIFFHQRKCGGTTLRTQLYAAAKNISAESFIPCFSAHGRETLDCETYYTPQISNPALLPNGKVPIVYGGHFYYPSFQRTIYLFHNDPHNVALVQPPPTADFTCLTIFREPTARIQSCWNFRMVEHNNLREENNVTEFASIPAIHMRQNLTTAMSSYGEGCLNEPMRIFSDYGNDEFIVNHLHEPNLANVANHATEQTLSRIAEHCVVGIFERCADTRAAIAKYIPFLEPYMNECSGGGEHLNGGNVSKGILDEEQLGVIRKLSWYEDQIYQAANRLLDVQIQ
ncbi:expressed unknown protein [Seminavis robusta]|uniref:Sulfotransferase n=1 Tax=Seminavis robusta TaxID=568900 RepID=A0A9N8DX24_9STRA|nr:expressed unknown protein [Seminavis robusta]|eukprot:Sro429_g141190.1 n/a (416) ;mRNA; f:58414-59661